MRGGKGMGSRYPYDGFTVDDDYAGTHAEGTPQEPGGENDLQGSEWYEQAYDSPEYPQSEYEQLYEQSFYQAHEQLYMGPYQEQSPLPSPVPEPRRAALVSTNATINLTCTLCAGCGLFGLFLYFSDKRSRAVRRCAVQSAGLLCVTAFLAAALTILAALFDYIPLIGRAMNALMWILLAGLLCTDMFLRIRLMSHAYRGEAYVLPVIGRQCRQYE